MLHTLGWFAVFLFGLFFAVSGAVMLVSPRTYFQWLGRLLPRGRRMTGNQYGPRWTAIQLWTRVRGALLLATIAWVAYRGFVKIR